MFSTSFVKTPRVEAVDALRGFAVMAILLIHNVEHFIFPVYPETQPAWLAVLNDGVFSVVFSLFAGKAYAIFALLFGFTFYIQYANQQLKGRDFGVRFLWRLVLLAGFATINAAFFPAGDVLLLFAVVGIVLVIVRKWSDRAVLALAVLLLLQPVEWFHYFCSLFNSSYTLPDLGVGAMYQQVSEYTRAGDFGAFVAGNVTLGQKASLLWAVGAGRFLQTAGLFLLGLLLGFFLHLFIVKRVDSVMMMFGRTIGGLSYLWSFLLTVLFAVIVYAFMLIKLNRINMADSLKSNE